MDSFDYNRCGIDTNPSYEGGDKALTTYQCIFSLRAREKISPVNWGLMYIDTIDYVTISSGGNHRSLAMQLTGYTNISPSYLRIYSPNNPDKELNTSLLNIEKTFRDQRFYISNYKSEKEIERIKIFEENISNKDKLILEKYMTNLDLPYRNSYEEKRLTIDDLFVALEEIREVQGHNFNMKKSFINKFKNLFIEREYRQKEIEKIINEVES